MSIGSRNNVIVGRVNKGQGMPGGIQLGTAWYVMTVVVKAMTNMLYRHIKVNVLGWVSRWHWQRGNVTGSVGIGNAVN